MNNDNTTKFEFKLSLENNIICQRLFAVNNYQRKAKNSIELNDYIKKICNEISSELKNNTLDYLNDNSQMLERYKYVEDTVDTNKAYFSLQIKHNETIFIERIFPAFHFPPKVRYTVDIRPKLTKILNTLTDILSRKNVKTKYLNYDFKDQVNHQLEYELSNLIK